MRSTVCGLDVRLERSHFTGKERDAESGNDYFEARYFGSSMGRFLSPDPLGGSLANPQSLNRYAYALNNPLVNTDPTGMYVCSDDPKDGSSHCASAQDQALEKTLASERNSSNADVARAAGAYGAVNTANGVTVGFADLSKSGEDGTTHSTIGTDASGNLQAQSNITINSGATGAAFDAAVGHEGSHAADAQAVVGSISVDSKGNFTVGQDITRYQSEQRAYGVSNYILNSEGAKADISCGVNPCVLGRGVMQGQVPGVVNQILGYGPNGYSSGGKPLSQKNQGGSVVNGVDQFKTPAATVPH